MRKRLKLGLSPLEMCTWEMRVEHLGVTRKTTEKGGVSHTFFMHGVKTMDNQRLMVLDHRPCRWSRAKRVQESNESSYEDKGVGSEWYMAGRIREGANKGGVLQLIYLESWEAYQKRN